MRLNVMARNTTHEGADAAVISDLDQLRRAVMSCLLWEDQFYESGKAIAERITDLALAQPAAQIASLAIEARETMQLRHVPLLLLSCLAKTGSGSALVSQTIARVIQRADELGELLAIHSSLNKAGPANLKKTLSNQMRKGLALAFGKFDEYQLAKYNRDTAVKLRDVLFLVHAKAANPERDALYKRLIAGELKTPDTWEVALSVGGDKKDTFERLLRERKLGYLALLRNLRNMVGAGVDPGLVSEAILARRGRADRVLPFRYVAAARAAPIYEPEIDKALIASIGESPMLPGITVVLVDVSGSMDSKLSAKSDMTRLDAAAALASIVRCEKQLVYSFSDRLVQVPHRVGMAGIDAIQHSQVHNGTRMIEALNVLVEHQDEFDRLIVISDEQAHWSAQSVPKVSRAYMINVASYQHGIGYGEGWTHIDGWSESVLRYIAAVEALTVQQVEEEEHAD